jgi:quinol-cytochrome oxidoreductase complex cytochrome b subunit
MYPSEIRLIKQPFFGHLQNHLVYYPTPTLLNYFYSFGSLAGFCLIIQIISGILLAMFYTPNSDLAFMSIEHIMRNINYGWLIRYTHSTGASLFFVIIYIHMLKNLYYGTYNYPRNLVWQIGVIIYLLLIITAFLGYVLPWGQMSFWAATVITNLLTTIPYIGTDVANWVWGGFSIDNPTLNRFFSLHFVFPFIISALALLHIVILHVTGSSQPLSLNKNIDEITFYPYFYLKDLFCLLIFLILSCTITCYIPNIFNHPDNYIMANQLVTPSHLVPEWYLLPYYAMLRAIPNKLGGLLIMLISIILLVFTSYESNKYSRLVCVLDLNLFVLLGIYGGKTVETPYIELSQILTFLYLSRPFLFFI